MPVHAIFERDEQTASCIYPPTPQNSLFIYLRDPISARFEENTAYVQQPLAVVVGPQVSPVSLRLHREHLAIRVGFHPAGLYRLLGIPLHELVNKSYDATHFFGPAISSLVTQLQHCTEFDEMVALLETFLIKQLCFQKELLPFDLAMQELLKSNGMLSIDQTASLACLSNRQFERVCKERIGLPPKYFARLIRFSKAYRMREEMPATTWTNIAHTVGYYDQMHLIRDFKEFARQTPRGIEKELDRMPMKMQRNLQL
jgi:AraC-like DNA-binding protein